MNTAFSGSIGVTTNQDKRLSAVFHFEQGKIYTLQGPNQIGKTLLVKLLTGAATSSKSDFHIGNTSLNFDSPASANRRGVCAVYQEDDLLPTMRVDEQIALRHLSPSIKDVFEYAVRFAILFLHLPIPYFASVAHWIESRLPHRKLREERLKATAKELLKAYTPIDGSTDYLAHFTSRPSALSGGAKAVVKLVAAQLTPGLKYLFLDEVFRGVQPSVWPGIVRSLRTWAEQNRIAIIAVTHSDEEVVRWNPYQRLLLRETDKDGIFLQKVPPESISRLAAGIPNRIGSYPVVEIDLASGPLDELGKDGPFYFLFDKMLESKPSYKHLRQTLNPICEIGLEGGESVKDWANYEKVVLKLVGKSLRSEGCLVIIGGGSILNFGGFVAATLNRGMRFVLVPTTIMAIADVAIGSKTSLNLRATGKNGKHLKHPIGLYANPDRVILDRGFLDSLSITNKKIGLAECVKHGLCQDEKLWHKALDLLGGEDNDTPRWYEVAVDTMHLKSDMLSIDPWEMDEALVLLFGHLHAHALERALQFSIPHGIAVYWGMLIDLHLANDNRFNELLSAVTSGFGGGTKEIMMVDAILSLVANPNQLIGAYDDDTKIQHKKNTGYSILKLSPWGRDISREPRADQTKKFTFDEVNNALGIVAKFLS